jgi:AraC-like DNA-binding protein
VGSGKRPSVYFASQSVRNYCARRSTTGLALNRYKLLHATPDLSVSRFDHPPHEAHDDPEGEVAGRWAIAFVCAGSFDVVVDSARRRLSRGSVFLTRPGLEFRCQHADRCPTDVCLSIGFAPGAVSGIEEAWERAGWAARESATPRLAYVDRRMSGAATNGDQFEMERWALAALTALQADTHDPKARGHYASRRDDVDAVVAACRAIETDPMSRRSIADRARGVGLTSPQLTHWFRRYVGASPHRYVIRWRLAASTELLASGLNVSESCYRSGFENLSHFCRTFHRILGVRASAWHALAPRERRRKVQDLTGRRA